MMGNKWKIELFVDEPQVRVLTRLLDCEIREHQNRLELTSDETEWCTTSKRIFDLEAMRNQIRLPWIEREEELIPPPNQWSDHLAVVDARRCREEVYVVELTEDDLALAASILREHGREMELQSEQCLKIAEALCNARVVSESTG